MPQKNVAHACATARALANATALARATVLVVVRGKALAVSANVDTASFQFCVERKEMKELAFSRFAHVLKRGDTVALYHTLKMRPVFLAMSEWKSIVGSEWTWKQSSLGGVRFPKKGDEILSSKLVEALLDAKILVCDLQTDDRVLAFFRSKLGTPQISIAYFILTDKCNFSCSYCFVKNGMPSGYREQVMSLEIAAQGLDRFCALIAENPETFDEEKTIIFYGGEPLMNMRAVSFLTERIHGYVADGTLPKKTSLSIITNGSLITKRIAEFFASHEVSVGISIDGDERATNANRETAKGEKAYGDVLRGFELCKEAGVNVGISCTLSPECVERFDSTLETLVNELDAVGLGFNLALASPDYPLPLGYAEQASECIIKAYEVFRKKGIYEDRIMRKVKAFSEAKIHPYDCGASGGGQIVIAPDGGIGICHGFLGTRKFFSTNVYDSAFNPKTDPVFLEWARRSPLFMEQCQECFALGICGGGCPLQADIESGSIWELDKRFCVHSQQTLEWLIWDLFDQLHE